MILNIGVRVQNFSEARWIRKELVRLGVDVQRGRIHESWQRRRDKRIKEIFDALPLRELSTIEFFNLYYKKKGYAYKTAQRDIALMILLGWIYMRKVRDAGIYKNMIRRVEITENE